MDSILVNTLLKGTEDYQYELFSLINREDSFSSGFNNYIKKIEAVYLKDAEIEEVIAYIKANLQGDSNLWTEEKVEIQVKNWRLNKSREFTNSDDPTSVQVTTNTTNGNNGNSQSANYPINKTELRTSVNSIPDSTAKEILLKIINDCEDEEILKIIKRYVD